MTEWLEQLFALVCGQRPEHSFVLCGECLPLCQRCTGIYVGAAIAALLYLWRRPRRNALFLSVGGLCLLQMVPMGFYWIPQGPVLRTMSGVLFGFGLVAFLWLPTKEQRSLADRADATGHESARHRVFFAGLVLSLAALPSAATFGGGVASAAIWILSVLGLAALAGLAIRLLWLFCAVASASRSQN